MFRLPSDLLARLIVVVLACGISVTLLSTSTVAQPDDSFSRADRLRGSVTPERQWWDLRRYELAVDVYPDSKSIKGSNVVHFRTLAEGQKLQIDLQKPLEITKVQHLDADVEFTREGNVYWIQFAESLTTDTEHELTIQYQGTPVESKNPPWSGGISWKKDEKGNPFIATSCQGIGASIWWPTKDHGYDEPDDGMTISITVPDPLVAVSNGRLVSQTSDAATKRSTYKWQVLNPINNYCVNMNIGHYVSFDEKFQGEGGTLDVQYWVLEHQEERAREHFKETPRTLKAFEHWFGKYPFYEDSYKLVSVPYLGMEHQSSVTYGNGFQNGYRGRDLSGTGVGLKFDFIIVHESGHEWFGNNISMKDVADMWIHEGFTNYSENLFVEYHFNEKEAQDYVIGCRRLVRNDSPIIGTYNVHDEGSGDMYYKGGNMLHTIRHIINDDKKWRSILRGLNETFWHQTVDTNQVESYISERAEMDLSKIFDQYLRDTKIPKLVYSVDGKNITCQFQDVVDGFAMPLKCKINDTEIWLNVDKNQQVIKHSDEIESFQVDRNFYVRVESK